MDDQAVGLFRLTDLRDVAEVFHVRISNQAPATDDRVVAGCGLSGGRPFDSILQ